MGKAIRVLMVEDSEGDAHLVLEQLRKNGFEPEATRVDSRTAMQEALAAGPWDIILCDYVIPGFGAPQALRLVKELGLDLPFVIVSGQIGEETAVEVMRAGAADYVLKDRLGRLGPVIRRELADAAARRDYKRAQVEWTAAFDSVRDAIFLHDAEFRVVRANLAYTTLAGLPVTGVIGKLYWELFPRSGGPLPGCLDAMEKKAEAVEEEVRLPNGQVYWSRSFPVFDPAGKYAHSVHVMQNVTERSRVKDALEHSERRFRHLIEDGSDMFQVLDREGRVRYRSPSGARFTGWQQEQVLGRSLLEFVAPEDVPAARRALADLIAHPGAEARMELRGRHAGGATMEIDAIAKNLLDNPDVGGIILTMRDITARKRNERTITRLNRLYATLSGINAAIVRSPDREQLLREVCRVAVEHGQFSIAWVAQVDPVDQTIRPVAFHGVSPEELAAIRDFAGSLADDSGPTAKAIRENRILCNNDYLGVPVSTQWHAEARKRGIRGAATLPVRCGDDLVCVLKLYVSEEHFFDDQQLALLEEMRADIAFALENFEHQARRAQAEDAAQRSAGQLNQVLRQTIETMGLAVETRDPYTAGHQRRVAGLAVSIGRELGLAGDRLEGVGLGAVIHDIGKISLPADILSRPGRISAAEMSLVRSHPEVGHNIVKGVDFPWPVGQMILQHHERLDGSGYPAGLKGAAIIPEARILAVADVVEAMTSHRPYRPARGIEEALAEIEKGSGIAYDADAARACARLFREQGYRLPD